MGGGRKVGLAVALMTIIGAIANAYRPATEEFVGGAEFYGTVTIGALMNFFIFTAIGAGNISLKRKYSWLNKFLMFGIIMVPILLVIVTVPSGEIKLASEKTPH